MQATTATSLTIDEIIRSFPCYDGPNDPEFLIDFLGTKTRPYYITAHQHRGGEIEGYPFPGNFHATALEWAGSLRAALEARTNLVVVELGAGWAPWLVAVARAAQMHGIESCHLVGVEGSKPHCEYMKTHLWDNGFDPADHTLIHGVVGATPGIAEFPILPNPGDDWGAAAIYAGQKPTAPPRRSFLQKLKSRFLPGLTMNPTIGPKLHAGRATSHTPTEKVPCYTIESLLKPFPRVDLVHVDIQGAEYDVITTSRKTLQKKVRRLVIGTHGRDLEDQLLHELAATGWLLENEEPCTYIQQRHTMSLARDGCQVWRNPRVA